MKIFYPFKWKYPKFMHLIPEVPTEEEFIAAWKTVFSDRHPDDCNAIIHEDKMGMSAFGDNYWIGGGDYSDNDSPVEVEKCNAYYHYGSILQTDKEGNKYPLLKEGTNLPYQWDEFQAKTIIKRYLIDTNIHHAEYPKMMLMTTQERFQDMYEWLVSKEGMPLTEETITELLETVNKYFIGEANPLKAMFK